MAVVYLETSFVSACVTDRQDPASVYRRDISLQWWNEQRGRHEVAVSQEVIEELSRPEFRRSFDALALIADVPLLEIDGETAGIAEILVRERVMPQPARGDALHVAVCCQRGVDCVLSWNVKHLANPSKIEHLRLICRRLGLIPPTILTPENYFWEDS